MITDAEFKEIERFIAENDRKLKEYEKELRRSY